MIPNNEDIVLCKSYINEMVAVFLFRMFVIAINGMNIVW